jgi:hypothetical protein
MSPVLSLITRRSDLGFSQSHSGHRQHFIDDTQRRADLAATAAAPDGRKLRWIHNMIRHLKRPAIGIGGKYPGLQRQGPSLGWVVMPPLPSQHRADDTSSLKRFLTELDPPAVRAAGWAARRLP